MDSFSNAVYENACLRSEDEGSANESTTQELYETLDIKTVNKDYEDYASTAQIHVNTRLPSRNTKNATKAKSAKNEVYSTCSSNLKRNIAAVVGVVVLIGVACVAAAGLATSTEQSVSGAEKLESIPVHGGWSPWGNWSICSRTCGVGMKQRHRKCDSPDPMFGGNFCQGDAMEYKTCENDTCAVHGSWNAWGNWSTCSRTCGVGIQQRYRQCDSPEPIFGGSFCHGDPVEYKTCENDTCAVNGSWSTWDNWNTCSRTCGVGIQQRHRQCDSPEPMFGGNFCHGNPVEYKTCENDTCAVNGDWGNWVSWTSCSRTCGEGIRSRRRQCTNPRRALGGVFCNGDSQEYEMCESYPCIGRSYIRLVNGSSSKIGRVELNYQGVWGTVCDDGWDSNDAIVLCMMLGYRHGVGYVSAYFGQGTGPIWLTHVGCTGTESDIQLCPHTGWGVNSCGHNEDAGVACS